MVGPQCYGALERALVAQAGALAEQGCLARARRCTQGLHTAELRDRLTRALHPPPHDHTQVL